MVLARSCTSSVALFIIVYLFMFYFFLQQTTKQQSSKNIFCFLSWYNCCSRVIMKRSQSDHKATLSVSLFYYNWSIIIYCVCSFYTSTHSNPKESKAQGGDKKKFSKSKKLWIIFQSWARKWKRVIILCGHHLHTQLHHRMTWYWNESSGCSCFLFWRQTTTAKNWK